MIRAPECVDALEARIASNVEYVTWKSFDGYTWHSVRSKSFSYVGLGKTPEAAVTDFLESNFLE